MEYERSADMAPQYEAVLKKARSLARLYKRSPTKNDCLQENISAICGKELSLLLDVKTRWNSVIPMCQRLLTVRSSVDALHKNYFSENDWRVLQDICDALGPVKVLLAYAVYFAIRSYFLGLCGCS